MSTNEQAENGMEIGGRYNWKSQPEQLVFIGRNWSGNGYWNQFEKVDEPGKVWCEVLDSDLHMIEKTTTAPLNAPAGVVSDALMRRAYEVVHHEHDCPAVGGNGDKDCRCDAVPFLRDIKAALSAPESAAPGEAGPVVAWMTKAGRVINTETHERVLADAELGGEYVAAAKAAEAYCIPLYTTPPAQPAERVPDVLAALYAAASKGFHTSETCGPESVYLHKSKFPTLQDLFAFEDAWRKAMLAASPAPSEGGKGVDRG